MKINIDNILKQQGKSKYWLSKEINFAYPNLSKLCANKANSIKLDTLEKICKSLNCTPNDILIPEENK